MTKTRPNKKSAVVLATPAQSAKHAVTAVFPQARSENPMDWLYDNPLGTFPNFVFGILRQSYRGFPNSAVEFGGRKLRPIEGRNAEGALDVTALTAYRVGTVLPRDAPDAFDDAGALLQALDRAACPQEQALLVYLTLSFPEATRLHHCWEEARAFCYAAFARQRQLPVVLCQHRPGEVGSSNPVHLHLLVSPRRIDGTGFRGYATDLLCEEAQQLIFDEWLAFRSSWV